MAFWLVKSKGYTTIRRAGDDRQVQALIGEGDQLGYLWKQGLFEEVYPA